MSDLVLTEPQWAALARLFSAAPEGKRSDEVLYTVGGFDWGTVRGLFLHQPPLIEEVHTPPASRIRLTAAGRAYYAREWQRYHALYPAVEAPRPEGEREP